MRALTARFIARFNLVFAVIFAGYAGILFFFARASKGFAEVSAAAAGAAGTLYEAGRYGALRDSAVNCHHLVGAAMEGRVAALEESASLFVFVAVVLVWNFLALRRLGATRTDSDKA